MITHIRGLITAFIATHEPPSIVELNVCGFGLEGFIGFFITGSLSHLLSLALALSLALPLSVSLALVCVFALSSYFFVFCCFSLSLSVFRSPFSLALCFSGI